MINTTDIAATSNYSCRKEHFTLKEYSTATAAMYCMAMNVSIKQPVNVDTKTKAIFIVYQVCLMFTVKYSSRDLQHTPAHCMIVNCVTWMFPLLIVIHFMVPICEKFAM